METVSADTIPGARKAAILIVVLGVEASAPLLKNLPREAVSEIVAEVARLDEVDPETAQAVLESYFMDAVRPQPHQGGRQVAQRLLASADLPGEVAPLQDEEESAGDRILSPLLQAPPATLASVLGRENSQTAALVLLNLDPDKAGPVLSSMPEENRTEILKRMTVMRQVRGEVLGEVAETLKARLGDVDGSLEEDDDDSLNRTAAVLRAMSRAQARAMLDELETDDAERAAKLRQMVNTFDTLALANDRGIQELLRVTETKTLAVGLQGEDEQLVEKVLKNLSERAGGMLREEIEFLGSVKEEDKRAAQKEIMEQALRLEQEDKLSFSEPAEPEGE